MCVEKKKKDDLMFLLVVKKEISQNCLNRGLGCILGGPRGPEKPKIGLFMLSLGVFGQFGKKNGSPTPQKTPEKKSKGIFVK